MNMLEFGFTLKYHNRKRVKNLAHLKNFPVAIKFTKLKVKTDTVNLSVNSVIFQYCVSLLTHLMHQSL